jgi:hypothetical protein
MAILLVKIISPHFTSLVKYKGVSMIIQSCCYFTLKPTRLIRKSAEISIKILQFILILTYIVENN